MESDSLLEKEKYSDYDIKRLEELYGRRFNRGYLTAKKGGVVKHIFLPSKRVLWSVRGRKYIHILFDDLFCSCTDFYMSVVIKRKRKYCYHQIAQIIAKSQNLFSIEYHNDDEWIKYIDLSKEYMK